MGAPVIAMGFNHVWRAGTVRIERDKSGWGHEMSGTHPCGLIVVVDVAEEAETNGIAGRYVR